MSSALCKPSIVSMLCTPGRQLVSAVLTAVSHGGAVCCTKDHAPEHGRRISNHILSVPSIVGPEVICCQVIQCPLVKVSSAEPDSLPPDHKLCATSHTYASRYLTKSFRAEVFVVESGVRLVQQPQVGREGLVSNATNYLQHSPIRVVSRKQSTLACIALVRPPSSAQLVFTKNFQESLLNPRHALPAYMPTDVLLNAGHRELMHTCLPALQRIPQPACLTQKICTLAHLGLCLLKA